MNQYENEEKKELREITEYNKDSLRLLTNHEWMEKVAVRTFLRICDVEFKDADLKKSDKEPPDIVFKDAKFEVTEVQDEGRRRGDESKENITKSEQANHLLDLGGKWENSAPMEFSELLKKVQEGMDIKFEKYKSPETCKELDLLVYVNLKNRHLATKIKMDYSSGILAEVRKQGWRSVSFLTGLCAGVIFADEYVPDFLKKLQGVTKITSSPDIYEDS
ncbi:MAG: DUF1780 domain-containing protein [Phycisphaerae bacterium]|nr:DUF1780 domain-containing protein [Phycisphaerae bacterium]